MLTSYIFYTCVAVTAIAFYVARALISEDGKYEEQVNAGVTKLKDLPQRPAVPLPWPHSLRGKTCRATYAAICLVTMAIREAYAFFFSPDTSGGETYFSRLALKAVNWLVGKLEILKFVAEAKTVQQMADSKTHFTVLMEKRLLGIGFKLGESEVESYNSVKRFLGEKWPFMWEVSQVRQEKITCTGMSCYPMSSYAYLDLLRDQRVQDHAIACAKLWATGNHGPRMLGGNTTILRELELQIGKFFGRDDSLVLSAGFLATMSTVAGVASENDILYADSWCHASLRTGLKVSPAKVVYFKHNNFASLEEMLKKDRKKYRHAWIVLESVYSMDGDICDLPAADKCAKKYDVNIIIDEAHGLGVLGATGRGIEEHFGLQGAATLICGTFSKSISSVGGYITGSKDWISYMDFHAPGNVFSAPLSAYHAGAAIKSFSIIDTEQQLIERVHHNTAFLRKCLTSGLDRWPKDFPESSKYVVAGDPASTVIPIIFPDDIDRVMRVSNVLKEAGWMVSAVAYPACSLRKPRFRITGTSAYTEEIMENFAASLVDACVREPPSESAKMMQLLASV